MKIFATKEAVAEAFPDGSCSLTIYCGSCYPARYFLLELLLYFTAPKCVIFFKTQVKYTFFLKKVKKTYKKSALDIKVFYRWRWVEGGTLNSAEQIYLPPNSEAAFTLHPSEREAVRQRSKVLLILQINFKMKKKEN